MDIKNKLMKKIFVYGTLLEGLGNWNWALNRDGATKVGNHILDGNYSMVSCGGFPAVVPHEEGNTSIHGEVFEVNEEVYSDIEGLEGYPVMYQKETINTPWGDADMYIMTKKALRLPTIVSGNWRNFINPQND